MQDDRVHVRFYCGRYYDYFSFPYGTNHDDLERELESWIDENEFNCPEIEQGWDYLWYDPFGDNDDWGEDELWEATYGGEGDAP